MTMARAQRTVDRILLSIPEKASPVVSRIGEVFARQVARRCPARVVASGSSPLVVALAVEPGIGAEGFRIEDRPGGGVKIVGDDARGLLYGAGKFLRASRYERDGFVPGSWRGSSVPWKPVRGVYFATHFHNFYHEAPVGEIEDYVEDLALWGFNELLVWYDLHHFNGPGDLEAVAFRDRLRAVMAAARRIGMDVSLTLIGNEGYADSPEALRATPGAGRGGYYPCGACPSRPEGMAYLLEVMGSTFDWVADLSPRSIWVWPYDQGGCGCEACRPWGSQGFMVCVDRIRELARAKLPGAKLVVSTWMMDACEIAAVMERLSRQPGLADALVVEGPVPAAAAALGLPVVGFPEISMHETFPWGGFGATPLPARAQLQWDRVKSQVAGGFPYSEGVYEDITKAVYSQFYWGDRPAAETVREYIAFEFSPDVVDEVAAVVETLERNHHFRWWPGLLDGVKLMLDWFPSRGAEPRDDPGAEAARRTMEAVDARLTPQARRSWRWRQLLLRARLDAELKAADGAPTPLCEAAFAELIDLYHAQRADPVVRPPLAQCASTIPILEFHGDARAPDRMDVEPAGIP